MSRWGTEGKGDSQFSTVLGIAVDAPGNVFVADSGNHRIQKFVKARNAPGAATLVSPSGSISTSTPSYTWNALPTATWYQLWVNDVSTSPKIQQWYTADQAGCSSGTGTCTATPATALALGNCQWWIQTWNDAGNGPWSDGMSFTVKSAGELADLTSPVPSSTITSTVVYFKWTAGARATQYWLQIGTSMGGSEIYNQDQKNNLSALVGGLPNDGSKIFARLWSLVDGNWRYNDYTYSACAGCGSILASITSPLPGSTLISTMVTFGWTAGSEVTGVWLSIGKTPGGSEIFDKDMGTNSTATVMNLPNDGSMIYVRLWSQVIGYWAFNDYSFKTIKSGSAAPCESGVPCQVFKIMISSTPENRISKTWYPFLGTV